MLAKEQGKNSTGIGLSISGGQFLHALRGRLQSDRHCGQAYSGVGSCETVPGSKGGFSHLWGDRGITMILFQRH